MSFLTRPPPTTHGVSGLALATKSCPDEADRQEAKAAVQEGVGVFAAPSSQAADVPAGSAGGCWRLCSTLIASRRRAIAPSVRSSTFDCGQRYAICRYQRRESVES